MNLSPWISSTLANLHHLIASFRQKHKQMNNLGSDLLGVALVVDDIHKGCNLAFRYPAPPASLDHVSSFHKLSAPLIAKLFRPKNALCNASFELVIDDLRFISHPVLVPRRTNAASTTSSTTGASTVTVPSTTTTTAAATAPPASAAPTSVAFGPTATATATANGVVTGSSVGGQTQQQTSTLAPRENDTTMFNIIFVLDEHRQQPFQQRQPQYSTDSASASSIDDGDSGVSVNSTSNGNSNGSGSTTSRHDPKSDGAEDEDARQQRYKQRIAAFRTIAAQLANGLLHEELRAGFVSREVRELLHTRDELLQQERHLMASNGSGAGGSGSANTSGGGSGGGGGGSGGGAGAGGGTMGGSSGSNAKDSSSEAASQSVLEVDPQTLIDVSLGKSVLANDLKSVFHGLEERGTAHVVVNDWVKLSLTLTDAVSLQMHNLRPYQTLLLLTDEDAVLNALPPDHSHQLRVLIAAANPLKSFQDLTLETSIPIHQLFRLSAHLVYWGYGRVVDTITMHNFYQVHPKKSLRATSTLALEFKRTFPPHELCEVLSSFNGARRLGDSVKNLAGSKKIEYIHMLIWLLQRDFIIQLHRYVYFMVPSEHEASAAEPQDPVSDENQSFAMNQRRFRSDPRESRSFSQLSLATHNDYHSFSHANNDKTTTTTTATCSSSLYPSNSTNAVGFSDRERLYLDRIATTNPVFALFKRLCVYFHGQYHFEEIMWRENVSRSELRAVLSTYQGIIVCCLHE